MRNIKHVLSLEKKNLIKEGMHMKMNLMKNRKKLRKPIAVFTAAVLAFVMTPQVVSFGKVETTEDGGIKVTATQGEVVNETRNTDIVAQKYGLYLETGSGGKINYTLNGNIEAAKEAMAYQSYYDAIRMGGSNITLKAGDISAPEGRAFYADFGGGTVTLGNLKSKEGISAMCTDHNFLNLTFGNMESEKANYLHNRFYGSAEGGNITANFGDITTTAGEALSFGTSGGGTITVKAGKLKANNAAALSVGGSSGGKAVVNVGEIVSTGEDFRSNVIYSSGGQADIDVTVDGNAVSEGSCLSLGDGGVYKIFGNLTSKQGDAIRGWSTYDDTDILVTGTVTAADHGFNSVYFDKKTKVTLTLWKLVWGEKSQAFLNDDENETYAKTVNYIVKTTQPTNGSFKVVKADGTSALDTKTYKHGDKDEVFEVAHQGDRLYLKSDKKILKAYNGSGANKVELPKDAAGNYYYDVVKGGGIELSAEIEGGTTTPTAAPTASPGPSASPEPSVTPVPTTTPKPTATPVAKKANPMTVTVNRIYGKAKHTVTVPRNKAFNIKNAKGTLSFKKISGSKRFTINKKTGDIRIEQHLKKGKKYFMVVQVTAAGNRNYKSKSVKVELRIKIH